MYGHIWSDEQLLYLWVDNRSRLYPQGMRDLCVCGHDKRAHIKIVGCQHLTPVYDEFRLKHHDVCACKAFIPHPQPMSDVPRSRDLCQACEGYMILRGGEVSCVNGCSSRHKVTVCWPCECPICEECGSLLIPSDDDKSMVCVNGCKPKSDVPRGTSTPTYIAKKVESCPACEGYMLPPSDGNGRAQLSCANGCGPSPPTYPVCWPCADKRDLDRIPPWDGPIRECFYCGVETRGRVLGDAPKPRVAIRCLCGHKAHELCDVYCHCQEISSENRDGLELADALMRTYGKR